VKTGAKAFPHLFIKKKEIAWLINGKPDEKRYNKARREHHLNQPISKPVNTHNL
jgi:hypothetical protein